MSPNKTTILIVDDSSDGRRFLSILIAKGYVGQTAEDAARGFESYIAYRNEVCLVLSDIVMQGNSVIALAHEIRLIDPDAAILLMSGFADRDRSPGFHFSKIQRAGSDGSDRIGHEIALTSPPHRAGLRP